MWKSSNGVHRSPTRFTRKHLRAETDALATYGCAKGTCDLPITRPLQVRYFSLNSTTLHSLEWVLTLQLRDIERLRHWTIYQRLTPRYNPRFLTVSSPIISLGKVYNEFLGSSNFWDLIVFHLLGNGRRILPRCTFFHLSSVIGRRDVHELI